MGRYSSYDDYKLDNPYHNEDDSEPDYDDILQRQKEEQYTNLDKQEDEKLSTDNRTQHSEAVPKRD
jgi:hypothetical protein